MEEIYCAKITIYGKVQGIGFRFFVKNIAEKENVSGYVKNNFDGSVEIFAKANKKNFDNFIFKIKTQHPYAVISKIEIVKQPLCNFNNFFIWY